MSITLPETVAVGIYNSSVSAKNYSVTKSRKTTMFEIEIPIEEGGISYINENSRKITTDMMICAKPGQLRHTKTPYKCYYTHFILNDGQLYDILINAPDFLKVPNKNIYEILRQMSKYYDSGIPNDTVMLQSLTLKLIYLINKISINESSTFQQKNSNKKVIEDTISFIKENITSDLSLQNISNEFSFSPIHFHNVFKASTGKTLRDYVEDERLKKAKNLLLTTNMSLAEIAYTSGFSSQAYFSFVFKRKNSMTPREYVKQINELYEK